MRPPLWHPPIELSTAEHAIIKSLSGNKAFIREDLRSYA
jgi:hypothetical protein